MIKVTPEEMRKKTEDKIKELNDQENYENLLEFIYHELANTSTPKFWTEIRFSPEEYLFSLLVRASQDLVSDGYRSHARLTSYSENGADGYILYIEWEDKK